MKKIQWGMGLGFFILLLVIVFINRFIEVKNVKIKDIGEGTIAEKSELEMQWKNPLKNIKLIDNKAIYAEDQDEYINKIYVTVLPPRSEETVAFKDLNTNIKNDYISDEFDPVVEIIFEADKPGIKDISYHAPNATMEIRGQSSRLKPQKSYKVKLFDDTGDWHGFTTINLNKHFSDALRIRNKLSFDYFEIIPDFFSLRTRFVKLYIRDLSSQGTDKNFKYYGLYTFIEQPNKNFLKRHNLDPNGHLYKAEFFEFYRYPESLKKKENITYDKDKFGEILETRGNDNHEKLLEMLEAVNDYNKDINDVVDKYFDRDNLLTWVGVNILFDNYDSNSRNFLLYSPLNSSKWFFIPWDYDGAWMEKENRGKWQKSISNYWGMILFNRFIKDEENVEALSRKIEELTNIINEENTHNLLDNYYLVVKESIFTPPDVDYLKTTTMKYKNEYYDLVNLTERNKQYYYETLENPMPFFLGEVIHNQEIYEFTWDNSYDLQGDELSYDFILSTDYKFTNVVAQYKDLKNIMCNVGELKPGTYYWKVVVYDAKGNWQEAFDRCEVDDGFVFGIKKFTVN